MKETKDQPEVWLRGPVEGIHPLLMPAAHALLQAQEELEAAAEGLSEAALWARPGGAASIGFHLRHVAGSIDRLLTYARGEMLDERQRQALAAEQEPGSEGAGPLVRAASAAIAGALRYIRTLSPDSLLEPRGVGRKGLPSTVLGLVFHVAEHTARHTGQVVATKKILQGLAAAGAAGTPSATKLLSGT